jgi:uncharacterized membrane protein
VSAVYNRIAGQSVDRLAALSDGVFAFAVTVLVINLHPPAIGGIQSEHALWNPLRDLAPELVTYLMSFLTLGIFWIGQQAQLSHFARSSRDLAWIHLGFLLCVTMVPFSTALLTAFISFRIALLVYWLNILLLGAVLYASWRYAEKAGLVRDDVAPAMRKAVELRILRAQALYAIGAVLCIAGTYWSIGFIVLVQLNYAVAPRFRMLYNL